MKSGTLPVMHGRLLLLQVRTPGDPMAPQEQGCIERRIGTRTVQMTTRNVIGESAHPDWLDGHDAIVIGGSGAFSVHDPRSVAWVEPLRGLLDAALKRQIPGFGVCFGHQLLGLHLGSRVETVPAHAEVGTQSFTLTEAGKADAVFGQLPETFRGQTGHSDAVMSIPSGVELLATSPVLETQVFKVRGTHFYSAQFHPDLTGQEARGRWIAYHRALEAVGAAPPATNPDVFHADQDDASRLLGMWLDVLP
ncbi:MAG: GMP synthase (glutamine-hydrolyzing) [Myxococcota bacterium]|jgi:GMP synthase (glutamine-hydrolysing)